jgi:hypothetical protein
MTKVVTIAASAASASVRSDFDFTVDKFPLFGPDNMKTDQYGLFRSDKGYIEGVKSISSRYVPHSTDDVCALVEAAAETFDGDISCKTHWSKGHYVSIEPTAAERRRICGENDNIWPRIIIRGGFDGKGFQGTMGFYRDACRNLAMLRTVAKTSVCVRHTSGLRAKMDELVETFSTLKEGWTGVVAAAEDMESRKVDLEAFLKETFHVRIPKPEQILKAAEGEKVRAVTVFNEMIKTITDRCIDERERTQRDAFVKGEPKIVSAWEAFNAVQGYVQHAAQAKEGFKSDFARILRASNDKFVHRAEVLALGA